MLKGHDVAVQLDGKSFEGLAEVVPTRANYWEGLDMLTLTRNRQNDGKVYVVECPKLRDAHTQVAWCVTDNTNATRREASTISVALTVGVGLIAHGYTFTVTR
jgi:hypothetical protein